MSDIGDVLTELAELDLPEIVAEVLPDLMNIIGETKAQGTGGGMVKSAAPVIYANVPVLYEVKTSGDRVAAAETLVSDQEYKLLFARYDANGTRINVDPKSHRLLVLARGNEPAKTFRIVSIEDHFGVYIQAVCEKEN